MNEENTILFKAACYMLNSIAKSLEPPPTQAAEYAPPPPPMAPSVPPGGRSPSRSRSRSRGRSRGRSRSRSTSRPRYRNNNNNNKYRARSRGRSRSRSRDNNKYRKSAVVVTRRGGASPAPPIPVVAEEGLVPQYDDIPPASGQQHLPPQLGSHLPPAAELEEVNPNKFTVVQLQHKDSMTQESIYNIFKEYGIKSTNKCKCIFYDQRNIYTIRVFFETAEDATNCFRDRNRLADKYGFFEIKLSAKFGTSTRK